MFSTKAVNEYIDDSSKRAKMGMGIHSNCVLESVEIAKTKTGIDFMEFIFVKKEDNSFMNQRVWFPNGNVKPYEGETKEEALQREINSKLAHIVKILKCFVSTEKGAEINAASFEEFCAVARDKILKTKFKDTPVYLKVTYDKDGIYTEFPRFPNYIQVIKEGEPCKLKFSTWEKENRCTSAAITIPENDNPLANANDDDLPF